MRNKLRFASLFGYSAAIVTFTGGLTLLFNLLDLPTIPFVRLTFGSLLVLVGIYRFLITWIRSHSRPLDEEDEATEE